LPRHLLPCQHRRRGLRRPTPARVLLAQPGAGDEGAARRAGRLRAASWARCGVPRVRAPQAPPMSPTPIAAGPRYTPQPAVLWGERLAARGGLVLLCVALVGCLTAPLAAILMRAVQTREGAFAGL